MQNINMLELLKESKSEMAKDGFLILGVFGSFVKLDEIKESPTKKLQAPVDIVYKKGLPQNSIAEIEKEMVYA